MQHAKALLVVTLASLCSACFDTDNQRFEDAKTALASGQYDRAGEILLTAFQDEAQKQARNFQDLVAQDFDNDLQSPHPLLADCQTDKCRSALASYGYNTMDKISQAGLTNFSLNEFKSVSKLLHQSEQGLFLTTCIIMDALTLMESYLGSSANELREAMAPIIRHIQSLAVPKSYDDAIYQAIATKARSSTRTKSCNEASADYNQLKKELKKLFGQLEIQDSPKLHNHTKRAYYHALMLERYQSLIKAATRDLEHVEPSPNRTRI